MEMQVHSRIENELRVFARYLDSASDNTKIMVIDGASEPFLNQVLLVLTNLFPTIEQIVVTTGMHQISVAMPIGGRRILIGKIGNEGQLILSYRLIREIMKTRISLGLFLTFGDKLRLSDLTSFILYARRSYFLTEIYSGEGLIPSWRYKVRLSFRMLLHLGDSVLSAFWLIGLVILVELLAWYKRQSWK